MREEIKDVIKCSVIGCDNAWYFRAIADDDHHVLGYLCEEHYIIFVELWPNVKDKIEEID